MVSTSLISQVRISSLLGVVSACLWDNDEYRVSGILTVSDFVNLMAYYYKTSTYDDAAQDVESLRLDVLSGTSNSPTPLLIP